MSTTSQKLAQTSGGTAAKTPTQHRVLPEWRKAFTRQNLADTMLTGYLPILVALLIIVLPLAWMISSSFKPVNEIITLSPTFLPQDPSLDNYETVDRRIPLLTVFQNSLIVTAVGSVIKVVLAITTAYALVFIRVPGANLIFLGILVALMVPRRSPCSPTS